MIHVSRRCLLPLLFGLSLAQAAQAGEQKLKVDDMQLFYGIVPAESANKQAGMDKSHAHGRWWMNKHLRHLVVALFDARGEQRVPDATIDVVVTPLGMAAESRRLDPLHVNGTLSYCNFFEFMPGSGPYRVVLSIARPNRPMSKVAFDYRP